MSKRAVYHVTPDGESGWQVKEESAKSAASTHSTKEQAVAAAKEQAKAAELGQVVIHKQDGTIQTEHTYGKDPNPPKG